jgi:hypothetical protein
MEAPESVGAYDTRRRSKKNENENDQAGEAL